jgi:hypothetical protein
MMPDFRVLVCGGRNGAAVSVVSGGVMRLSIAALLLLAGCGGISAYPSQSPPIPIGLPCSHILLATSESVKVSIP